MKDILIFVIVILKVIFFFILFGYFLLGGDIIIMFCSVYLGFDMNIGFFVVEVYILIFLF